MCGIKVRTITIVSTLILALWIMPFLAFQEILGQASSALQSGIDLIIQYDNTGNVNLLKQALETLRREQRERTDPSSYYYCSYYISEAEVKEQTYLLRNNNNDSHLSEQARAKIRKLWSDIKSAEERFWSAEFDADVRSKAVKIILERGATTIVESARFLDHANSLAPLIKNIINRVERYGYYKGAAPGTVYLLICKELLEIDYPNAKFLSSIKQADYLDKHVESKKASLTQAELDSLKKEAASLAIAASGFAATPYARYISYYLAGKNLELGEGAVLYYNDAIAEFDSLPHDADKFIYLNKRFSPSDLQRDFINFIYEYGKELQEKQDFLRYAALLENGWRVKDLEEIHKLPLAMELTQIYSVVIDQFVQQGKYELAEGYKKKQEMVDVYINAVD